MGLSQAGPETKGVFKRETVALEMASKQPRSFAVHCLRGIGQAGELQLVVWLDTRLVGNQPLSVWVYSALDCETHRSSRDESRAK